MAAPCGFSIWTEKLYDGQFSVLRGWGGSGLSRAKNSCHPFSLSRRIY
jgi:hypothetical protein